MQQAQQSLTQPVQPAAPVEAHQPESHDGVYILSFVLLAGLTFVEVLVTYASTVLFVKVLILLLLAAGKATIVAGWYMHLRYEKRFMPFVFLGPIILAVLMILTLQQLLLR